MRRAAVVDLFDRIGLTMVPAQMWRFSDADDDVATAVGAFLDAIGGDVDAVRRGEADEIERVNELLDLLVEIERAFDRLGPDALARIELAIFSGEHETVRAAARVVAAYERIVALGDRWPPGLRLATLTAFLDEVAAALADPLSSTPADAEAAQRAAATLAALMERFAAGCAEQEGLVALLRAHGDWRARADAGRVEADVVRFATIADRLRAEPFSPDECDALIAELEAINGAIAAALRIGKSRAGGRRSTAGARPGGTALSELEIALLHFGFAKDAAPSPEAFRKRYRELAKEAYPPPAGRGSDALFKELGKQRDVLKDHFGFR